jgi:SAM-dependent methyltransferase
MDTRPAHHHALAPSGWVERFAHLVPAGGRVLDVAAGRGRHARFFTARGARVLAVDRDADALAALRGVGGIETRVIDLESGGWPLARERFDAIVVVNYLHRALFPHLVDALADDGALLYETFAIGNERFGRPSNPDFLLREDELLARCRDRLTIVAFEQGWIDGERPAVVQRLAAVGRKRIWPPLLGKSGSEMDFPHRQRRSPGTSSKSISDPDFPRERIG